MKRAGNLYEKVCSFDNLCIAWRRARQAKPNNMDTMKFGYNLEENLLSLREELLQQTYLHGNYRRFMVHDPKEREIWAATFKDRVVHHALCNIIDPIFNKTFITIVTPVERAKALIGR